nr:helix-turn-helix transcriptional regulator [Actinomycetota bacterium]
AEKNDACHLTDLAVHYDQAGAHWLAGETAARALSTRSTRSGNWVSKARQVLHRLEAHPDVRLPSSWFGRGSELTRLTERERQIVELVSTGRSTPLIAARLHLSQRTVENHLQHAYRKLGVRRRQDLAVLLSATHTPLPVPRPTDERRSALQPDVLSRSRLASAAPSAGSPAPGVIATAGAQKTTPAPHRYR